MKAVFEDAEFRRAILIACPSEVVMTIVHSLTSRGQGQVVALGCDISESDRLKFSAFMTVSEDADRKLSGMLNDPDTDRFDFAVLGGCATPQQGVLRFLFLDRLLIPGGRLAFGHEYCASYSSGWSEFGSAVAEVDFFQSLLSIRGYCEIDAVENWVRAKKRGSDEQFRKFAALFSIPESEHEEEEQGGATRSAFTIPMVRKSDSVSVAAPRRVLLKALDRVQVQGEVKGASNTITEFWVDHNLVGVCGNGEIQTTTAVLEMGEHHFSVISREGKVPIDASWVFCGAESEVSTHDEGVDVTPENLAVITIAAYPSEKIYDKLRVLAASAERFGFWLHVLASSQPYSHARTKVAERARWVRKLPAKYKHILFIDSRDCLFVRPIKELCALYNEHRRVSQGILIGAESPCFPINETWWRERFPENGGHRWINSGMFMGSRAEVCDALANLLELHERMSRGDSRGLEDVWGMRVHAMSSEQVLWQIAHVKELFPLALDSRSKVFANLNSSTLIRFDDNPYSGSGGGESMPAVLHFPGPQAHAAEVWAKRLGILAEF